MHVIGDQLKFRTWCPTCKGMLTFDFWGVDGNEEPVFRCWLCGTVIWHGAPMLHHRGNTIKSPPPAPGPVH